MLPILSFIIINIYFVQFERVSIAMPHKLNMISEDYSGVLILQPKLFLALLPDYFYNSLK